MGELFDDLARWEQGTIGLEQLIAAHAGAADLLQMYSVVSVVTTEREYGGGPGWDRLVARLDDRVPPEPERRLPFARVIAALLAGIVVAPATAAAAGVHVLGHLSQGVAHVQAATAGRGAGPPASPLDSAHLPGASATFDGAPAEQSRSRPRGSLQASVSTVPPPPALLAPPPTPHKRAESPPPEPASASGEAPPAPEVPPANASSPPHQPAPSGPSPVTAAPAAGGTPAPRPPEAPVAEPVEPPAERETDGRGGGDRARAKGAARHEDHEKSKRPDRQ